MANPAWIPPSPWLQVDPGVWTIVVDDIQDDDFPAKLVISATGWCVTWADGRPPLMGPAYSLASAAIVACAVTDDWTRDPSFWPLWGDDGSGPAGLTSAGGNDLLGLAETLFRASDHLKSAHFWRDQAASHRETAAACEAFAGGIGDGIASSAPAHRAAAERCDEACHTRITRATTATEEGLELAERLGAVLADVWPDLPGFLTEATVPSPVPSEQPVTRPSRPTAVTCPDCMGTGLACADTALHLDSCLRCGSTGRIYPRVETSAAASTPRAPVRSTVVPPCDAPAIVVTFTPGAYPRDERQLSHIGGYDGPLVYTRYKARVQRPGDTSFHDELVWSLAGPLQGSVIGFAVVDVDDPLSELQVGTAIDGTIERLDAVPERVSPPPGKRRDDDELSRFIAACDAGLSGAWQKVGTATVELHLGGDPQHNAVEVEAIDGDEVGIHLHVRVPRSQLTGCVAALGRALGRGDAR